MSFSSIKSSSILLLGSLRDSTELVCELDSLLLDQYKEESYAPSFFELSFNSF